MNRTLFRLLFAILALAHPAFAKDERSFFQIREVIGEWSSDLHLRTSGELGVSAARLAELESWLGEKAPNWTVVLMQSARSQVHDGRSGMDAVEFALGEGLSNETGFGQLVDPRTGEANGAVFVLFLEERKFSYFASDVYDNRQLGERHWIGRLDAPAINAMRNGGRILDAVKNTITSIDTALTRKLDQEAEQKRLAELERQRAITEAKSFPARLETKIDETRLHLAAFTAAHPTVTGPLAAPDFAVWEAVIPFITGLVSNGDLVTARKEFLATCDALDTFQTALDQWEEDVPRFDLLEGAIGEHPRPGGARLVAGSLASASDAVKAARANHAVGDPLYSGQLAEASGALADATRHLAQWREAEARRKALIRAFVLISVLATLVFLLVANRLRRSAKVEAESLFRDWREKLRGRFDELYDLMDRSGMVVRTGRDLEQRGYTDLTGQLARELVKTVDELFIMSTATDLVMDEAGKLIAPRSPLAQCLNAFSARNYRRGIGRLSGEPIGFDDQAGLAAILGRPGTDPSGRHARSLLGRVEDYEPFKLSFARLIEAYDAHQHLAQKHLARLAAGIDGLPQANQELDATVEQLTNRADELSLLANDDRLFPLNSLRTILLPAAEKSLDRTEEIGRTDPVTGFESLVPIATRLVSEMTILIDRVTRFRKDDLPRVVASRDRLRELGRTTTWMDNELSGHVHRSEEIAATTAELASAESLAAFDEDLTRFTGRSLACVDLTLRTTGTLSPRLAELKGTLATARRDLGSTLGLAPDRVLVEPGLSPEEKLETARCAVEVALSAIDRGEAIAARQDLDEAERCLDDADSLIRISVEGASTHREITGNLRNDLHSLEEMLPSAAAKLREMQDHYAPAVLLFSAPYNDRVNGPASVLGCVERATRLLADSAARLNESEATFTGGAIIRAHGLLETAADELDFARHQIALIEDHHAALKEIEASIAPALEKNRQRQRDLGVLMSDRRTCRSTLTEYQSAGLRIEALSVEHAAGGGDPFVRGRQTAAEGEVLTALDDGVRADWKAHALSASAATGARAALAFCLGYLREAAQDGIPDSEALKAAIRRHAELAADLDRIDLSLDDAHGEWPDSFDRINALTGEIAGVRSTLEEELAAAREAVAGVNAAAAAISELHRWRSRHSVPLNREAGVNGLAAAKERLANGRYANARELAMAATGVARHELEQARAAESAKVRAAAAAAAASLAASRHRSSAFSSSSGFRSSSSSGFSRSGGSSGSGFSRSGW